MTITGGLGFGITFGGLVGVVFRYMLAAWMADGCTTGPAPFVLVVPRVDRLIRGEHRFKRSDLGWLH